MKFLFSIQALLAFWVFSSFIFPSFILENEEEFSFSISDLSELKAFVFRFSSLCYMFKPETPSESIIFLRRNSGL